MVPEFYDQGCVCPACEVGTLRLVTKTIDFEYHQARLNMTREVWECAECRESFFQTNDKGELEKSLTDWRRTVDGLLISEEITKLREKLRLTIAALAKLLGISPQQIEYYERGQSAQSYEIDNILRILREYPEAIQVLQKVRRKAPPKSIKRRVQKTPSVPAEKGVPQLV